jgi:hypothetical protein
MMPAYHLAGLTSPFAASEEQFSKLTGLLQSTDALVMEHSELEKRIQKEGTELMRRLFQDHLNLRACTERDCRDTQTITGADGVERAHRRQGTERGLMTVFGPVRVLRAGYSAPATPSLYPLDAELNLPADSFSHGVRERVARQAAQNSFEATVAEVSATTGAHVAKRQAEGLAHEAARDFDEFYRVRHEAAAQVPASGSVLVVSVDGKGICMRPEGLRDATRCKAQKRRSEPTPPCVSLKRNRRHAKRMATVAAVYTIEPYQRSAEQVARNLAGVAIDADQRDKRPNPEKKRIWASLTSEPAEVIRDAFAEASARAKAGSKRWVALVDGNQTQLGALKEQARMHGISLTIVLDLLHVLGYLWKAARILGGPSNHDAFAWLQPRMLAILHGNCSDVAAGLRRSATRRQLKAARRKPVDDCADYLLKYREYLRYDDYLAAGLPIATGVIEGACRHLIQDRMDITGARWGLGGAEAILRLRALWASGDFDDYWRFHLEQERHLNHTMLYASDPPTTRPAPAVSSSSPARTRVPHLHLVP